MLALFYSSSSRNTARFAQKLERPTLELTSDLKITSPFVLLMPTFADGEGRGAVPKPVIRFLNDPENRGLLRGVIAFGNRNFGNTFALGGRMVAAKCGVPLCQTVELAGTEPDVALARQILETPWTTTPSMRS